MTQFPASDSEYIVIRRSWLVAIVVGMVGFVLGGIVTYIVAFTSFQAGRQQAIDAVQAALAQAPTAAQAGAAQPSELPVRVDNVSADDDPAIGPDNAPIQIVEFSDFRCPYCKRFRDETLPALLEQYGDQIRFVYRDFAVVGGETAAEAAECADDLGEYWEYHDALFENPQAYSTSDDYVALAENLGLDAQAFRQCLESGKNRDEVMNDYNAGRSYGVSGTPTFFINGVRVVGAQPLASFQGVIEDELSK